MGEEKTRSAGNKGRYFRGEETRGEGAPQRILKAARKVFAEHPFKAATTRMIAKDAHVDHPLIHYYFGSKEKLFEAVTAEIYEEFHRANISWLEGTERMKPRDGLSLYIDRLLDYNIEPPEPLQLILVNMVQAGSLEEIPGYQYIIMHLDGARKTLEEKLPIKGAVAEVEMFIHCFNNLVITFLGAKNLQAQVLRLDPQNPVYRMRVKDALMSLFLPWLERLIFADKNPKSGESKTNGI
jgi:AcrR family transcriptional regulator